jgi:hypothetical protein
MARVAGQLATRAYVVPWRTEPPVGVDALRELGRATAG